MWYSLYYIIIYNDYIRDKDYHSLCDYIIIDMIIFLFICCLCISLLSMMLLYKDNYPYVVIEIYFHFMFVFWGSMIISGIINNPLYGGILFIYLWWFFILFVLYVIIYHRLGDKDYHWPMIIFFLFYVFVWGYGHIILVIINFLDHCYLYHRAGIYFILGCDIPFYLCSFGILMYVIILSLFYDGCKGFFYYPWSMMSSDLNCVCWW